MHTPEILISAALIVFAIVVSAALVAVCIVVAGSFIAITTSLVDRAPRFLPIARRETAPRRSEPEEPRAEPPPPPPPREMQPYTDQLATDIVTNAAEGIIVYDRDLRCVVWNRFMEDLTGLPAKEVIGKRASDLFPQTEHRIDDLINRALTGETVSVPETYFSMPNSERQGWISASLRPQHDASGQKIGR